MGRKKRGVSEINASSMADIAFLLLIFFLVTTEIAVDEGIPVSLPPWTEEEIDPVEQNDRNTLTVLINSRDQLLVEEELFEVKGLREFGKKFVKNNGVDPSLSDNPQTAIISFKGDRGTSYDMYINVYNELRGIYNDLRDEMGMNKYQISYRDLMAVEVVRRDTAKINDIRKAYPIRLSEAEPTEAGKAK